MKLYYWKSADGVMNFGDDLNSWIFQRTCPGLFDKDDKVIFVGIGSILNNRIPKAEKTLVFSSGVGYADLPVIDSSWKIYCLRGLLSAKALKVPEKYAITDGAVLAKRLISTWPRRTKYSFSYMPHMSMAIESGDAFREVCENEGINYIDPLSRVDDILSAIINSDKLITEALHGAIIADSMRVPWIRVRTNDNIYDFKWLDWQSSLNLKVEPIHLFPIWALPLEASRTQIVKRNFKKWLMAFRLKQLKKIKFNLSNNNLFFQKEQQLHDKLYELISDSRENNF